MVTTGGAMEILGTSKSTFQRWVRDGWIPAPHLLEDGKGGESYPIWAAEDLEWHARNVGRRRAPVGQTAEQYAVTLAAQKDPAELEREIEKLNAALEIAQASREGGKAPKS